MSITQLQFKSPKELQVELGRRLQRLRVSRNIDQRSAAEKAGITRSAIQGLEAGRGSTIETLVRTLKALNYAEGIAALAPEPTINPVLLLKTKKAPQRARKRSHTGREEKDL